MEDTLSYLLRSVSMKYRYHACNKFEKDRWSISQYLAIYHIAKYKKIDQKNLAIKLNVTPASVSVIVKKLEAEGLLNRIPDEKDGRKFNLFLTEKGQSLLPKIKKSWLKLQEEITNGFSESEKKTLLHFLQKVEKNLDELTLQNY